MPYMREGAAFAYGYEPGPSHHMKELAEKMGKIGAKAEKFRRSKGREKKELVLNMLLKRRGTEKTTRKQSRAHTVKRVPYVIRIRRKEGERQLWG